jgi:hypothetical protein
MPPLQKKPNTALVALTGSTVQGSAVDLVLRKSGVNNSGYGLEILVVGIM